MVAVAEQFAKQTTTPKAPEGRAPKVRVNRTTDTRIFRTLSV